MRLYEFLLKTNFPKIFVDLDGVLVDFIEGANEVTKLNGYENSWERLAKSDIKTAWKIINELGSNFWANLDWTKDGKDLWKNIEKYNPYILSAYPYSIENPKIKNDAILGKKEWIRKNLGKNIENRSIICSRKEKVIFAGKNNILIDDLDKNIKEWERSGGTGILYKNAYKTIEELNKLLEAV